MLKNEKNIENYFGKNKRSMKMSQEALEVGRWSQSSPRGCLKITLIQGELVQWK